LNSHWKTGFEIELLAPAGVSRKDLADAIASSNKAGVKRIFYPQSEPSKVEGKQVFHNLVLGFEITKSDGEPIASCVDDLTIRADLDRAATGLKDWYRVISDDKRILNLILAQCDPLTDRLAVLEPLARLYGTSVEQVDDGICHVRDRDGLSLAIAATLPGERHRPCELISPPLSCNRAHWLETTLAIATELGFTIPVEAAVHIHFDGSRLRRTGVFNRLAYTLRRYGGDLRDLVGTNPRCIRLGPLPDRLFELIGQPGFVLQEWSTAARALKKVGLTKYADFNLLNLVENPANKPTFEVRILPGSMSAETIGRQAQLFEAILEWCADHPIGLSGESGSAPDFRKFLGGLNMQPKTAESWLAAASGG
jgi:hypothetical protein